MRGLQHPEWLLPLAVTTAALALLLLASAARAGGRRRTLLGTGPRLPGLGRDAALVAALISLGVALVGPRIGERSERVTASGVDLVALLDVSRSMDARDVAPSRLDRARRNLEILLSALEPGDRAALAAYAARGVLLTPLTADRSALLDMLPSVDGELMRGRSSDLDAGVRAALAAFDRSSRRPRVLLVLGDGEDPSRAGDLGAAAAEAARSDVRILALAIGSEAGSPVPDHGVPLRDAAGEVVRTRRDAARLAALAEATGGRLLATDAFGALDAAEALREVRRDAARGAGESVERRVSAVRVVPFAALAFVLLATELAAPGALGRRRRWRRALPVAATLICAALGAPTGGVGAEPDARAAAAVAALEGKAARAPFDPQTLLRLGLARARAGLGPEAERALVAAALYARDPALASLAYFDLGVVSLERGDLETARDAFFDALALTPADDEARFNLEWTLRALHEGVQPPPAGESASGASPARPEGGAGERPPSPALPEAGGQRGAGEESTEPAAPDATPGGAEEAADGRAAAGRERSGPDPAAERAPALEAGEAARWLRAVQDDPGRAFRAAARRDGDRPRGAAQALDW